MTYDQYLEQVNKEELEYIERLIDARGLANVLAAIADICGAKAEHVAVNWQDTALAKQWDAAAGRIAKVAGQSAN